MLSLFLKCLLGAVAVLLIALLSKSRSFFVAAAAFALLVVWSKVYSTPG